MSPAVAGRTSEDEFGGDGLACPFELGVVVVLKQGRPAAVDASPAASFVDDSLLSCGGVTPTI